MTKYHDFGAWLRDEHRRGTRFTSVARDHGVDSLQDAYAAQAAFVDAMQADGLGETVGWKIGLTSARMQQMCGIDQPVAGAVLASRLHRSGATVRAADHGRLGLEFEICVRIGADLPPRPAPYTAAEVAAAADAVAPAVEMVDDRHCDYATLDVLSLVADNSWNAGVVLGEWQPVPPDLAECLGVVMRDGVEVDRGHGRDALGGPLIPLEWLANHLRAQGRGLRRGDIVMTGSVIPTQFPQGGSTWRLDLSGLGAVEIRIA